MSEWIPIVLFPRPRPTARAAAATQRGRQPNCLVLPVVRCPSAKHGLPSRRACFPPPMWLGLTAHAGELRRCFFHVTEPCDEGGESVPSGTQSYAHGTWSGSRGVVVSGERVPSYLRRELLALRGRHTKRETLARARKISHRSCLGCYRKIPIHGSGLELPGTRSLCT